MPKVEKISGGQSDLRVTRGKGRKKGDKIITCPHTRVKCGCCEEAVVFIHEETLSSDADLLEINGVMGSVKQWRKVLGPLLGLREAHEIKDGINRVFWESQIN